MKKQSFSIGAACDIGSVRKSNQDSILVKIGEDEEGEFALFAVADGMGGHAYGDRASWFAVSELKDWWEQWLSPLLEQGSPVNIKEVNRELGLLIQSMNQRLFSMGRELEQTVGTTLSVLFIYKNSYLIKHVGDSRIYLLNHGIRQITEDHSWVAQQVRDGVMTKVEAGEHPQRNLLTRCLGGAGTIEPMEWVAGLEQNDSFILCSDGLHNYINERELLDAVKQYKVRKITDIQQITANLVKKVIARGAGDNLSVIIVCQENTEPKIPFFKSLFQ